VEHGEEPARDQVVDALVVAVHLVELVVRARRDDRVVVGDLLVVDHAAERQDVEALHVLGGLRVLAVAADVAGDRLELVDHVPRQKPRARPGVRERLVLLVQALGRPERAPRREAEPGVRVALQRGEVVEQRHLLGALGLVELGDRAALPRTASTTAVASSAVFRRGLAPTCSRPS
jgi:hypothetical protein